MKTVFLVLWKFWHFIFMLFNEIDSVDNTISMLVKFYNHYQNRYQHILRMIDVGHPSTLGHVPVHQTKVTGLISLTYNSLAILGHVLRHFVLYKLPSASCGKAQPMDRLLHWAVQSQGQWRSISTGLSPDRHRWWPPHPSQKKWRLQYSHWRKGSQLESTTS